MRSVDRFVSDLTLAVTGARPTRHGVVPTMVQQAHDRLLDAVDHHEAAGLSRAEAERRAVRELEAGTVLPAAYHALTRRREVRRVTGLVAAMVLVLVVVVSQVWPEVLAPARATWLALLVVLAVLAARVDQARRLRRVGRLVRAEQQAGDAAYASGV